MDTFNDYEDMVIEEIVRHDMQPNLVERALSLAGVPFEKVLTAARGSHSIILQKIAERLGYILTEKSLSVLIPIAGALLNGGLNLAFQQNGQMLAMDYFRRLTLERKYGEASVRDRIGQYANILRIEMKSHV